MIVGLVSAFAEPLPPPRPDRVVDRIAERGLPTEPLVAKGPLAPLSQRDAVLYRQIFELQSAGRWSGANRLIRRLGDGTLLGHVRFQRLMHPTEYRASYEELYRWMERYEDHPGAYRIYSLARRRQPAGAAEPKEPIFGREHIRHFLGEESTPAPPMRGRDRSLEAPLLSLIAQGHLNRAEKAIWRSPLPAGPSDRVRAKLAFAYMIQGNAAHGFRLAAWAAGRSRSETSLPDWVAGLAAYRLKNFKKAERHFSLHAKSEHAGEWNVSAGAYWAGLAAEKRGDLKAARRAWRWASRYPFTFYGQLGRAKLGIWDEADWKRRAPTQTEIALIRRLPGGMRALALAQAGQIRRADEELLQYLGGADLTLTRAITHLADHLGLPQSSVRGGFRLAAGFKEAPPPAVLYPRPGWEPSDGMKLDSALIWAFVRQESVFNPRATSSAGARGLMQLMPTTANYVAGADRFVGRQREALYQPPLNLTLGQRYLRYLMQKRHVGSDLFRLLTAYNAGVGNLRRWDAAGILADEPLMFIETLPLLETRLFVERVMANLWLYRQRMGQPVPSLTDLANNRWPQYVAMDRQGIEVARDRQYGY